MCLIMFRYRNLFPTYKLNFCLHFYAISVDRGVATELTSLEARSERETKTKSKKGRRTLLL